jgi:hypothetical protein
MPSLPREGRTCGKRPQVTREGLRGSFEEFDTWDQKVGGCCSLDMV